MVARRAGERLQPAVFDRVTLAWTMERAADAGVGRRDVRYAEAVPPGASAAPMGAPADPSGASAKPRGLTVVTWNIWFAPYYFVQRVRAMLRVVQACDPDVICLQEVTPASLDILLEQPWIQDRYRISDAYGATVDPYGVVILSRLPVRALRRFMLPTEMGRSLLTAEVETGAGPLTVATVHLESLDSAELRREQLEIIFPLLKGMDANAVLVGDFNLCSSWPEENAHLDPEFVDVWPALRRLEPGYTEDPDVNVMLQSIKGRTKQVRFDRVLLRSADGQWCPESIERLGTTPIVPAMPDVFPSDHFGLVARFVRAHS